MSSVRAPRSIVLGQGVAPVTCANLLRRLGHEVYAACGPDESLREWAASNSVPFFHELAAFTAYVSSLEFDYLFSIVNYRVLPASLLAMPGVLAVNYHDGPLPRYAGTYATSWALLNREVTHGVTWHVMVNEVDAGDILKQVTVPIDSGETAASLNRKCFVVAMHSFRELVRELDAGRHQRVSQDLTGRTYHGFLDRPAAACLVDFDRSAADVGAFIRALSFSPYENPVGTPKVFVDDEWVTIGSAECTPARSGQLPGSVVARGGDAIVVATRDYDLSVQGLRLLGGTPVNTDGKRWPERLTPPESSVRDRVTEIYAHAMRHERVWLRRLASVRPVVPFDPFSPKDNDDWLSEAIALPNQLLSVLTAKGWPPAGPLQARMLHARFFRRPEFSNGTHVGRSTPELRNAAAASRNLVACAVPVTLDELDADLPFAAGTSSQPLDRCFTFARDLGLRYPDRSLSSVDRLPIVFVLDAAEGRSLLPQRVRGTHLTVVLSPDDGKVHWEFPRSAASQAAALRQSFLSWLASLAAT